MWDWEFAWEILPTLLEGLVVTVQATLAGIAIALVLGLVLAILRREQNRLISWPVAWVIEFVRTTPLLVQLYFLFFVLPEFGLRMGAFTTGAVGLGIHYATYTSEVYRSGIEGVAVGQWEASTALNLSPRLKWSRIVLPQAIPTVIPALGNYLIAMFKEAALLSTITVVEVLREGQIVCSRTFQCLEPYTLVGVLFLVVSIPSSILVRRLERRLVYSRS
ncbi:MAG: ectoine/hydroxyectoine ABC transporter permease subunit EhuD [Dehalococcoidia bacterium]|nr:ectoine/hydroxyectoine ABC transporter permease subunit EhuD [Dehalococcoidia bacterium]